MSVRLVPDCLMLHCSQNLDSVIIAKNVADVGAPLNGHIVLVNKRTQGEEFEQVEPVVCCTQEEHGGCVKKHVLIFMQLIGSIRGQP
jgi:hypothetical protein